MNQRVEILHWCVIGSIIGIPVCISKRIIMDEKRTRKTVYKRLLWANFLFQNWLPYIQYAFVNNSLFHWRLINKKLLLIISKNLLFLPDTYVSHNSSRDVKYQSSFPLWQSGYWWLWKIFLSNLLTFFWKPDAYFYNC